MKKLASVMEGIWGIVLALSFCLTIVFFIEYATGEGAIDVAIIFLVTAVTSALNMILFHGLYRMADKVEKMQEENNNIKHTLNAVLRDLPSAKEIANEEWECKKCGVINAKGTTACRKCSTHYHAIDY